MRATHKQANTAPGRGEDRISAIEQEFSDILYFTMLIDRAIADRNRWREDDKEQNTVWDIKN